MEALAHEMVDSIADYGFPFFQEHATLRGFYESMRTRKYGGALQSRSHRVPVAAFMLGMPEKAKAHIAEYLVKLDGAYSEFKPAERLPIPRDVGIGFRLASSARPSIVSKYREFAERLLALMDADSPLASE